VNHSNHESPPQQSPDPFGTSTLPISLAFAATTIWCLAWWLLRPDERIDLFFREGGPIDLLNSTWLIAAAILAWMTWSIAPGSRLHHFWLVAAIGLLFLGIDERFQFHELLNQELKLVPTPFGLRNWSDLAVLAYGVVALSLLVPVVGHLWREPRLRYLGLLAVALGGTSTAIDSVLASSAEKTIVEETFKVLSGAAIFLTFAEGFAIEVRRRGDVLARETFPRLGHALVLSALCATLARITLVGSLAWRDVVARNWGSAPSWIVCVLLWSSAIALAQGWLLSPRGTRGPRTYWLLLGLYLAVVGFGEGILATNNRVLNEWVVDQFPGSISWQLAVLHGPIGVSRVAFLVSVLVVGLLGMRALRSNRSIGNWLVPAGLLLMLALFADAAGGNRPNDLYASILRIAGGACAVLGALAFLVRVPASQVHGPSR